MLSNFKPKLIKRVTYKHVLEIFLFGCVGLLIATVDTLITTFSYRLIKHLSISVLCGHIAALCVGYIPHKRITFKSNNLHSYSLVRYIAAAVIVYCVNLFIVYVFMSYLNLNDVLIPKILSIPLVALTSFLILKFWVFRKEK